DFAGFAARTVAAASKRYGKGSEEASAVEEAWATVGVDLPSAG
ncbi:MAG TPA: M4 family metallopeptidase, partial [Dermatophilaceae bacterium]|nr:M4 family metallopeptidase [Dermatophilaceae bacterium]HQD02548.1 M4 family metallopeptidase [Dermatophilaceae bacterium]HQH88882.1 M4 family metallopeptidase [Dermatophilaceae bacterium]